MAEPSQLEMLRHFAEEAFKKAAQSIRTLLGSNVKLELVSLEILPPLQSLETIGGQDLTVAAAYSAIKGDWNGVMLFMMPLEYAGETISVLVESFLEQSEIDEELAVETYREFANIVFGSIATALYNKTRTKIMFSPPKVVIDSIMAILESIAIRYSMQFDELLLFRAKIGGEKVRNATLLIIPGQGFADLFYGAA
ncbi:MAG: hypothetical protein DRO12_05280 [Thermoprotei archaeon]|nr:MAG: hypothetical protein DRO12_05280 [Thermoprotei archaeon]